MGIENATDRIAEFFSVTIFFCKKNQFKFFSVLGD